MKYKAGFIFILIFTLLSIIEYSRPENDTILILFLCLLFYTFGLLTSFKIHKKNIENVEPPVNDIKEN